MLDLEAQLWAAQPGMPSPLLYNHRQLATATTEIERLDESRSELPSTVQNHQKDTAEPVGAKRLLQIEEDTTTLLYYQTQEKESSAESSSVTNQFRPLDVIGIPSPLLYHKMSRETIGDSTPTSCRESTDAPTCFVNACGQDPPSPDFFSYKTVSPIEEPFVTAALPKMKQDWIKADVRSFLTESKEIDGLCGHGSMDIPQYVVSPLGVTRSANAKPVTHNFPLKVGDDEAWPSLRLTNF